MENIASWMYLEQIIGSFDGLVKYYFGALQFYAPWFRQAAVAILYSAGLALVAFNSLRAATDKLLSAVGTFVMIAVSGFLLSPTTDTKNLGSASGTELATGAYYSYALTGTLMQGFNDVIAAAWKGAVKESAGGGGPTNEAVKLAYNDKSKQFAEKFINGEGQQAYIDYTTKCGMEAINAATTPKQKAIIRSIGLTSNTLGMDAGEGTKLVQEYKKIARGNADFLSMLSMGSGSDHTLLAREVASEKEAKSIDKHRAEAEAFLKSLPSANSTIDGQTGYRIPTKEHYKNTFSSPEEVVDAGTDSYIKLSETSGRLGKLLASGAKSVKIGTSEDYQFYPTNCYDLYLVANETMRNFRGGVKGLKQFANLDLTQQYTATTAANAVRRAFNDRVNARLEQYGIDERMRESILESLTDAGYGLGTSLSNAFNKWMLEYKIPTIIASMAMLVAALLITFPIFAIFSVLFGPKVLVSYFKLMALPFIVVFINNFLLSAAASMIAFDKVFVTVTKGLDPGGVDVSSATSIMNTETVIYSIIGMCELAIAKFVLWDDARAVASFNMASVGANAAARGASIIGGIASFASGTLGRASKVVAQHNAASSTQKLNTTISEISKQVSNIAAGGSRSLKQRAKATDGDGDRAPITTQKTQPSTGNPSPSSASQSPARPGSGVSLNPPKDQAT